MEIISLNRMPLYFIIPVDPIINVVVITCDVSGLKVLNNVGIKEVDCVLLVVSIVDVKIAGSLVIDRDGR